MAEPVKAVIAGPLPTLYPENGSVECIFSNQIQVTGFLDSMYLDFCTIAPEAQSAYAKVRVVVTVEQAKKLNGVLAEIIAAMESKGASASGTKNPAV